MSRWQLQPDAITSVLTAVEGDLETMNGAWSAEALDAVSASMSASGPVGADVQSALTAVLNSQGERLAAMGGRVSAGLVGVESAVNCFEAGQEEMLEECQTHMVASAGSGDFSWWYGYERPAGAV
ncbi:DUF6507 family protein [Pseudactinotalea sp.]|uniref:DUF6507 family protein n=1 Tax=Pseudactinotalea sp. TaxID=1926260 RepID=UPI003B3B98E8